MNKNSIIEQFKNRLIKINSNKNNSNLFLPDIFLFHTKLPNVVRERYFQRSLKIQDLLDYPEIFQNIIVDNFMGDSKEVAQLIRQNYGAGEFQKLVQKYPKVFLHIQEKEDFSIFNVYLKYKKDLETCFIQAVKNYFLYAGIPDYFKVEKNGQIFYNVPEWLSSMNFSFVEKINNMKDLMQYNETVFILNNRQRNFINALNIVNIRDFEQETRFFSHDDYACTLEKFNILSYFFECSSCNLVHNGIDFKNGTLSYTNFVKQFANFLNEVRKINIFEKYNKVLNHDWMQGKFRNEHPELFMDLNAPKELKEAFYSNSITPEFLYNHKDYIPYLINKVPSNTINAVLNLYTLESENKKSTKKELNFIEEYVSRFGNEKLLRLLSKYGALVDKISIYSLNNEIDSEQTIEESLIKAIYDKLINSSQTFNNQKNYSYLANNSKFVSKYPELFIDLSNINSISEEEKQRLKRAFYSQNLKFDDIKKYSELVNILKDKNLQLAFNWKAIIEANYSYNSKCKNTTLVLLKKFGNEEFLQLCSKYGRYMEKIAEHLNWETLTLDNVTKQIEEIIIRESINGNIEYQFEDAPLFLKESHPELFLSEDSPELLKKHFYNCVNYGALTFELLHTHKEWIPFLKDKSILTALLRNKSLKQELIEFFQIFGEKQAIKLGINKAETVTEMLRVHQVQLMKKWYAQTDNKFIPDFVVMKNFSIDEVPKFLKSGSIWSNLMKLKNYAQKPESRKAMLNLAYTFGVFHQSQKGIKELYDLLTGIPKTINAELGSIINKKITESQSFVSNEELLNLLEAMSKENINIDYSKNIFNLFYKKNKKGNYRLTINPQSYPKTTRALRSILEKFEEFSILTPDKACQFFGNFELKYDADFREFLLVNMTQFMKNPENAISLTSIQKQFSDIKAINSNRHLTWELALNYVQTNKYVSVELGNEKVAKISAIAGYSQEVFNTLQLIYNYGKLRTFSSIPRIKKTIGKYTYEMLRLDEPLAMAIGTLTDSCQELNNFAALNVEHSMVDMNGRIFVVKDSQNNFVAQSWVWRNKDVLCFDNIEVPHKVFTRATKENPKLARKEIADEIFEIYKEAAHDLLETDEQVLKKLLVNGKITQQQYESLRLRKITVGFGFNDVADSLKQNLELDKEPIASPLPFEAPVPLNNKLKLYTSDSDTQFVLEKREDRKYLATETLPVHSDNYIEYSDANFTELDLHCLKQLELVTKESAQNLKIILHYCADSNHLVTEIARCYKLNPENTRIILNSNFAIIYAVDSNKLKISDLFYNTIIKNEQQSMNIENQVLIQINLALEQITLNKEIDISSLNEKQKEMYNQAICKTNEISLERGISRVRKLI